MVPFALVSPTAKIFEFPHAESMNFERVTENYAEIIIILHSMRSIMCHVFDNEDINVRV